MSTANYMQSDAFGLVELVKAINKRQHVPRQAGALGIFRSRGALSTKIVVEDRGSSISLIQTSERGAPASQYTAPKRTARLTRIPQIKRESTIYADELRELRAFGSETAKAMLTQIRDEHLADLGGSIDVTHEHLLMGALRGTLLDADGSTLLDTFGFFGETQEAEVAMDLGSATAGVVTKKCKALVRTLLNNLGEDAGMVDHIHAFCTSTFMDDLVTSKDYVASVQYDPTAQMAMRQGNVFRSLVWQDIVWEEYRTGNAALGFASSGTWVPADKAIFFPVGPAIYDLHFAPGDFFDAIDAPGLPMYARSVVDPEFNRWLKLHVQSNPLPICTRPKALMIARKGS
jgi:hypothetical protein